MLSHSARRFLGRHAGSLMLAVAGIALVVFSLVLYVLRSKSEVLGFTLFGVFCLVVGACLPRLREAEVSPQKFNLKMDAAEREGSVGLSLSDPLRDEQIDEPDELLLAARWYLGNVTLATLLKPEATSALAGCALRLYLYDSDKERLVPVLFSDEARHDHEVEEWEIGRGATGTAYARGDVVVVEGEAASDTTYGLTDEQSRRFAHLTAVMSVPVVNANGNVIAVITASSSQPGGGGLLTEDGYLDMLTRSMLAARILVDLLAWFPDRYPDADDD